jgi:glycosyltransferase involved in cell wall biosynthesis
LRQLDRRLRVMMIGPYPDNPDRIDGGVAAALTYLSRAIVSEADVDLFGVRITARSGESGEHAQFEWPLIDLSLGRLSLTTLYRRQRKRLLEIAGRHRPDVVHAHGADLAGFLAVGCGLPAVVTVHGLLRECARFQTNPTSRVRAMAAAMLTERATVRRAGHLIAISPFVSRYYGGDIRGKVYEIPNAIGPDYFDVRRDPQPGRLLFAGRIANGKGLEELLRAVAANAGTVTRLILAGATHDPAYEYALRREAGQLGLDSLVEFAGLLPESALLAEFGKADALVLPSHQETAPMVIQQAMAAGLPVIATKVGGIPFQVEHDVTGLLFEAGKVDECADLIRRLGEDPMLTRRLGDAARLHAATFRASAVARATVEVYRNMLNGHAARREAS